MPCVNLHVSSHPNYIFDERIKPIMPYLGMCPQEMSRCMEKTFLRKKRVAWCLRVMMQKRQEGSERGKETGQRGLNTRRVWRLYELQSPALDLARTAPSKAGEDPRGTYIPTQVE